MKTRRMGGAFSSVKSADNFSDKSMMVLLVSCFQSLSERG
jgi:hypothetical protein